MLTTLSSRFQTSQKQLLQLDWDEQLSADDFAVVLEGAKKIRHSGAFLLLDDLTERLISAAENDESTSSMLTLASAAAK